MSTDRIKKELLKSKQKIFKETGLVYYPEVIVNSWNPYSLSPTREKVYLRFINAWIRLHPDGLAMLEPSDDMHNYAITRQLAEHLNMKGVPMHYVEYTDVYRQKLEADLMKKPLTPIETVDVNGIVLSYNQPVFQSIIIEAINKFGNKKATKEQIIDILTLPHPRGGGWFDRTASLITRIEQILQKMTYQGILAYDDKTNQYIVAIKPSTTQLRGH